MQGRAGHMCSRKARHHSMVLWDVDGKEADQSDYFQWHSSDLLPLQAQQCGGLLLRCQCLHQRVHVLTSQACSNTLPQGFLQTQTDHKLGKASAKQV